MNASSAKAGVHSFDHFSGTRIAPRLSDLPGSRNGSGRPVSDSLETRLGSHRFVLSSLFTLLPYLVLLPMGFAEPSRSPGLLVSSYLAVSPLPRPWCKKHRDRGGLFSVALSLSKPLTARLDAWQHSSGVVRRRKVRTPQGAVVGNAHRSIYSGRESATENKPPGRVFDLLR